jgi:hypothetical protein
MKSNWRIKVAAARMQGGHIVTKANALEKALIAQADKSLPRTESDESVRSLIKQLRIVWDMLAEWDRMDASPDEARPPPDDDEELDVP